MQNPDLRELERIMRRSPADFPRFGASLLHLGWTFVAVNYDNKARAKPTSPGGREIDDGPNSQNETLRKSVVDAHNLALGKLGAASEHLIRTGELLMPQQAVFAPWATGRSVLEASGNAAWLLDTAIDRETRVARGLTDRLISAQYAVRMAEQLGEGLADAVEERDKIVVRAESVGLDPVVESRPDNCVVGERRPSRTELVCLLFPALDGRAIYNLFSGYAHSEATVVLDSRTRIGGVEDPLGTDDRPAFFALTKVMAGLLAGGSAAGFIRAVTDAMRFLGWKDSRWSKSRRLAGQVLAAGVPTAMRDNFS